MAPPSATVTLAGVGVINAHLPIPIDGDSVLGQILGQGVEEAAKHGAELGAAAGVVTYGFFADLGRRVETVADGVFQEMSEEERKDYDDSRLPFEGPPGSLLY